MDNMNPIDSEGNMESDRLQTSSPQTRLKQEPMALQAARPSDLTSGGIEESLELTGVKNNSSSNGNIEPLRGDSARKSHKTMFKANHAVDDVIQENIEEEKAYSQMSKYQESRHSGRNEASNQLNDYGQTENQWPSAQP
jgi:hypothetical protein